MKTHLIFQEPKVSASAYTTIHFGVDYTEIPSSGPIPSLPSLLGTIFGREDAFGFTIIFSPEIKLHHFDQLDLEAKGVSLIKRGTSVVYYELEGFSGVNDAIQAVAQVYEPFISPGDSDSDFESEHDSQHEPQSEVTTMSSKKSPIRVFLEPEQYSRYLIEAGTHHVTPSALGALLIQNGLERLEQGDYSALGIDVSGTNEVSKA